MGKFDKVEYNNKFNAEKYDRITIMLPRGSREKLQELSSRASQSVTGYIRQAIRERQERDSKTKETE